ncbi:MAG: serine/threonine protein kinase [Spirochaetales bacterium]|nr:serine/threonine protein kinase [Spirochaetales bacterium]
MAGEFDTLNPHVLIEAVAEAYEIDLDGTIEPFNSFINRVYGLTDTDGGRWIVKFYRPGRWTVAGIEEEHDLVFALGEAEVPVVMPLVNSQGYSLQTLAYGGTTGAFALYPRRAGRTFDPTREEDFIRLGSIVGRLHRTSATISMNHRIVYSPKDATDRFLRELKNSGVVHPEVSVEFFDLASSLTHRASNIFDRVAPRMGALHGDVHRGNILDRGPVEGLLLFDFDDCMKGPAVQDLWMLVSDRLPEAWTEWQLILEGYRQFVPFNETELELVESLRFMRMVYFLAWQNRQRGDSKFQQENPDWGGRAFWIKELEDLRDQAQWV